LAVESPSRCLSDQPPMPDWRITRKSFPAVGGSKEQKQQPIKKDRKEGFQV
jgi:hypothetical protein